MLKQKKNALLKAYAENIINTLKASYPNLRVEVQSIPGPRVAILLINAGPANGYVFSLLARHHGALANSLVPWEFASVGNAQVYVKGQWVRIEVPWPPDLQEQYDLTTMLRSIPQPEPGYPAWLWGIDETGRRVYATLRDHSPHWLVAGTTGSGKTTALLGAIYQLCLNPGVRLVLLDGKGGVNFEPLRNIPNLLGPIAFDTDTAFNALSYVVDELRRRYRKRAKGEEEDWTRIVIVVDEFQEFASVPKISYLLKEIATSGRAAHIHLILSTQHPNLRNFGPMGAEIKRNLPGRLVLKVLDADASRVAIGSSVPRADFLLGMGDAYIVTNTVLRVQVPFVSYEPFKFLPRSEPELPAWPEADSPFDDESSEVELLIEAIKAVQAARGRPWMNTQLQRRGINPPGAEKGSRLLRTARVLVSRLEEEGILGGNGHGN
jgi:DNA segregation ATPase FtsK/SpoIIIE-like protein